MRGDSKKAYNPRKVRNAMTDDETQVVEQADQPVQEVDQSTESENVHDERANELQKQSASTRNDADYNWKEVRRQLRDSEQIIREQRELINKLSTSKVDSESEDQRLSNDDYLTLGQAKKLSENDRRHTLEEVRRYEEEILRLKFPDFDEVLTQENISELEKTDREIAELLVKSQEPAIKVQQAAYKLIKKNLAAKSSSATMERRKAEANAAKPMSIQAAPKGSAMANLSNYERRLTPELMKSLYEEMNEAIKNF